MARRDRTTGLPRPQRRERRGDSPADIGWLPRNEKNVRFAILAAAVLLLTLVVGVFAFRWYDDNFLRPGKTVLAAGDETFSLSYYADRLGPFFVDNPNTSQSILPQALLAKLEEEALTLQVAAARNITITDDDIIEAIADDLGFPVDTSSGSAFDRAYRSLLNGTGLSDTNFRRVTEASLADNLLRAELRLEIGEIGETVMLRMVVVDTAEEADAIIARINAGEDMGSIAQVESIDVQSRVEDGLFIAPPELLGDEAKTAIEALEIGELAEILVSDGDVWVVRVERRDPDGTFTVEQQDDLVQLRFDELIAAARLTTRIDRNLSPDDISWAFSNVTAATEGIPEHSGAMN
jgi:parvulin-like peptidyl-prolyl isomerase